MPSRSIEDYLKYIYHIQASDKKVNTSTLASTLSISPASVSEMVSKLSKLGWITNTPYHGFKLTKKGTKISLNLVRKHRLIEVFLQMHLKYKWDEVDSEAERFEHVCSDDFINKLDKYLGYPKFDPHGGPIPDKNGKLNDTKNLLLSNAMVGKNYIAAKVNDASNDILKYISKIGIKLNSRIHLTEKLQFDGSVLVTINHKKHLLSKKIAENIFVTGVTNL